VVESLIGLALVALFCLIGWAVGADPESLIRAGMGLAAVGFLYGIPTAVVYHWLLYRSLAREDRLPRRWWLSPTSHHDLVPREDRRGVFVWGAVGGSGFVVIVAGILLTTIGLWRMLSP
jgi:hypothetical protein